MLETSSIQATSGQAATIKGPDQTLGQDQFLNLLIAQLKNQDPLNPVDNAQFMAQLAQFSQLEQTKQMTASLNTFIQRQDSANATGLVSFLGREVTAMGSSVSLVSGTPASVSYLLGGNAANVTLQIKNASGVSVRTLTFGNQAAGPQSVRWDGKDQFGNPLPTGSYSFAVTAATADGKPVSADTVASGIVTGDRYDQSGPMVVFDSGQSVAPGQILSVR
jgi:flagellar basal-body rod modification protein FlgD